MLQHEWPTQCCTLKILKLIGWLLSRVSPASFLSHWWSFWTWKSTSTLLWLLPRLGGCRIVQRTATFQISHLGKNNQYFLAFGTKLSKRYTTTDTWLANFKYLVWINCQWRAGLVKNLSFPCVLFHICDQVAEGCVENGQEKVHHKDLYKIWPNNVPLHFQECFAQRVTQHFV